MAGRRWAQGRAQASDGQSRPRPSERSSTGQVPRATSTPRPEPNAEAMRRAKLRLERPKAPWHPLPLAELAIVIGIVAAVVAAAIPTGRGIVAGFLLILAGTAEFSWREHHAGYRSHGAVLSAIAGFAVGAVCWEFIGLHRNVCLAAGFVVFFLAWGVLDRAYVPMASRPVAGPPDGAPPTPQA